MRSLCEDCQAASSCRQKPATCCAFAERCRAQVGVLLVIRPCRVSAQVALTRCLISARADVSAVNKHGEMPLSAAAAAGNLELLKIFGCSCDCPVFLELSCPHG